MLYDIETLLDDLKNLLQEKLNTKIDAIALEKSTSEITFDMQQVQESSYHYQTWSDKILTQVPAIFYGIEEIQANGVGPATLEVYKIFVEIIILDNGNDPYTQRRLLRYSRALKEVLQENYDSFPWSNKTKIETVRPVSFSLNQDTSEEIHVGGVSITTALV